MPSFPNHHTDFVAVVLVNVLNPSVYNTVCSYYQLCGGQIVNKVLCSSSQNLF